MSKLWTLFRHPARIILLASAVIFFVQRDASAPGLFEDRVRAYTREIEFVHESWMLDALQIKAGQIGLGTANYLTAEDQHQIMIDYIDLVVLIQEREWELDQVYADPNISDPGEASAALRAEINHYYKQRGDIAPLAESILEAQINATVTALGLSFGGQLVPPVLFHSTSLPYNLVVSPRDVIRKDLGVSLSTELTVDQQAALEGDIDHALDVSSLVVPIGGLGIYPTMVAQTSDLPWLIEVVAHEWTHNFLTLRPLGASYESSAELRIINETTASIVDTEIAAALIARFYPEHLPYPVLPADELSPAPGLPEQPPAFDFRAEMHETRLTVDQMLAEGQIEAAEAYMESRRQLFWEHDFAIRKLNQAYFAFYGQYVDEEGGARGASGSLEDQIGATIRALRAQSPSLADFLNRISWMWSLEQVQNAVNDNI